MFMNINEHKQAFTEVLFVFSEKLCAGSSVCAAQTVCFSEDVSLKNVCASSSWCRLGPTTSKIF
ncbi:hypothetical protein Hanom_Chr06g00525631 [Helianthus anomalus]